MTKKNIPAISMIIPMYNSEKYIGDCLESILAQTFQNYEIIVVDDCSTDMSCSIVENYISKFAGRLQLIKSKKNAGAPAFPRNIGVRFSRGKYLMFMDNDDAFVPNAMEEMYNLAEKFQADVVYSETFYKIPPDAKSVHLSKNFPLGHGHQFGGFVDKVTVETENFAERMKKFCSQHFELPPWDKLVRRDLLVKNEIEFPALKVYDDFIWTFKILCAAKKIIRTPAPYYMYRTNPTSITRKVDPPKKTLNFWIKPVIDGLKILDDFMNTIEFFKKNSNFRYAVLDLFARLHFSPFMFYGGINVPPHEIYKILIDGAAENNALISYLITALNTQQKLLLKATNQIKELKESQK